MKKYIGFCILIFFLTINFTYAQNNNQIITQKEEEIKQIILKKKTELKDQIQEKQIKIKEKIDENSNIQTPQLTFLARERVLSVLGEMFSRFDAVIVKYEGLVMRIESRIQKIKESNNEVDTSKIENLLSIAKIKVDESTSLIFAYKEELNSIIKDESSEELIDITISDIISSLRDTHSALTDIIIELKLSEQEV